MGHLMRVAIGLVRGSNSLLTSELGLKSCYAGKVLILLNNHCTIRRASGCSAVVARRGWPLTVHLCPDVLVPLR